MSQEIISEIFEYRALFTKDLTQKLKHWNDGRATYFKLNKKVQIHTEDGHLIAEKFADRALQRIFDQDNFDEPFRVGFVLVEIQDLIAHGQRDVARVFKKQKLDPVEQEGKAMQEQVAPPTIQRTPLLSKTVNTPLSLKTTVRRRRCGLSRNDTPSKRASQIQQRSMLNASEAPSPNKKQISVSVAETFKPVTPLVVEPTSSTTNKSPSSILLNVASKDDDTSPILQPKTPAALAPRSSMRRIVDRATPSKCTPAPMGRRPQQLVTPANVGPQQEHRQQRQQQPSKLLQKLLADDDTTPPKPTLDQLARPFATPLSIPKQMAPPRIVVVKPEPDLSPSQQPTPLQKMKEDSITWGTQHSSNDLSTRLAELHKERVGTNPSPGQPQTYPQSAGRVDSSITTPRPRPRPRIGRTPREVIRVERPSPTGHSSNNDDSNDNDSPTTDAVLSAASRTPLQRLQKNTSIKLVESRTPISKIKNNLITPRSGKNKVEVYMSQSDEDNDHGNGNGNDDGDDDDDDNDEIVETQIELGEKGIKRHDSDIQSQGRITQTVTFNYGGRDHDGTTRRVSEFA